MQLRSRSVRFGITAAALGLVAGSAAAVSAAGGGGGAARDGSGSSGLIHEQLSGYEEAPMALSTAGHGTFRAMVTDAGIEYQLTYADTVGTVSQAHIHFGAVGQAGGISVFLCTNLGNGPAGTQACPAAGEVTGTIVPADVIGPAGQGIAAAEYQELLAAIRTGTAYVNVHSSTYVGGEIRGQIEGGHEGHH
jgi:CHRD domain